MRISSEKLQNQSEKFRRRIRTPQQSKQLLRYTFCTASAQNSEQEVISLISKDNRLSWATLMQKFLSVHLSVCPSIQPLGQSKGVVELDVYTGNTICNHLYRVAVLIFANIVEQNESVRHV